MEERRPQGEALPGYLRDVPASGHVYGTLSYNRRSKCWTIKGEPCVTEMAARLFPGSERLMEIADKLEELKTMCWCGRKATCNARYDENGIVREGEQVLLGANHNYKALCRKHYKEGLLFPPN